MPYVAVLGFQRPHDRNLGRDVRGLPRQRQRPPLSARRDPAASGSHSNLNAASCPLTRETPPPPARRPKWQTLPVDSSLTIGPTIHSHRQMPRCRAPISASAMLSISYCCDSTYAKKSVT